MPNVVLATTMWDLVEDQLGTRREQRLQTQFWSDMVADGCRTERFDSTYDSAWRIVDSLDQMDRARALLSQLWENEAANGCRPERFDDSGWRIVDSLAQSGPAPVLLSREVVDTHLPLNETQAGVVLNKELKKLIEEQKETARRLREGAGGQANDQKAEIEQKIRRTVDQLQQLKIRFPRRLVLFLKGRN